MFHFPSSKPFHKNAAIAPLLSWDFAHPLLQKQIEVGEDYKFISTLSERFQWDLELETKQLLRNNYTLVITNLSQEIVWVSKQFETMTHYPKNEVIGRKPTFLQGEKTSKKSLHLIREKLSNVEQVATKLLNYRKNGEAYWCQVTILPIHNTDGLLTHFMAIEKEVDC